MVPAVTTVLGRKPVSQAEGGPHGRWNPWQPQVTYFNNPNTEQF